MGGGPLEEDFRQWSEKKPNIYYLGYTEHSRCLSIVKGAEFVVFPSICYEGYSMVETEAQSFGKTLIAISLGFSEEAIQDGYNRYKVKLGDVSGFIKQIKDFWTESGECKSMGINAREKYEKKYRPDSNYEQIMSIYSALRQDKRVLSRVCSIYTSQTISNLAVTSSERMAA